MNTFCGKRFNIPGAKPKLLGAISLLTFSLLFLGSAVDSVAAEGLAELQAQAKSGDAQAQYRLALLYWSGTEVPKNPKIAKVLLEKSAAAGWVDAKLLLAAVATGIEAAPTRTPQVREQTRPVYPMKMRMTQVQATVLVDFFVTAEGAVVGLKAVKISTVPVLKDEVEMEAHLEFGAAASAAVAQWKFEPGLKDGKPVATHMQVPVVFTLNDEKK